MAEFVEMEIGRIPNPIKCLETDFPSNQRDQVATCDGNSHKDISHQIPNTCDMVENDIESMIDHENVPFLLKKRDEAGRCLERYGKIEHIRQWIPEIDPNHARAKTCSVKMARRSTMLIAQALIALLLATAAVVIMAWARSHYPMTNGIGTFFTGDCSAVNTWDTITHLLLNVCSTLFLGAGNYAMQVLVAPSRHEVDEAHKKGKALDIGIHSVRNLSCISPIRGVIWAILGVIAAVLHIFWNSSVFTSTPFVVFPAAIVTSNFESSTDDWAITNPIIDPTISVNSPLIYALQGKGRNFTYLDNYNCIREYINPSNSTRELILVSKLSSENNTAKGTNSSLIHGWISGSDYLNWNRATQWICSDQEPDVLWSHSCTWEWAQSFASNWSVNGSPIDYCLVGQPGDNSTRCGFHFSHTIIITVSTLMTVDCLLLLAVAWIGRKPTLVTTGDAIASFLEKPSGCILDETLEPKCRRNIVQFEMTQWQPRHRLWCRAVSVKMWFVTATPILIFIALGFYLFNMSIGTLRYQGLGTSLADLSRYGLGKTNNFALVGGRVLGAGNSTADFIGRIIFVNMFQTILSIIYLAYNNSLTRQVVANHWTRYMEASGTEHPRIPQRKALRVSSHIGFQRSTFFLSLPYSYAVPLQIFFIVLHTLISRSCFVVQTIAFAPGPNDVAKRLYHSDASRVGYSSIAILASSVGGIVVLLALIANSLRRYPPVPAYQPRLVINSSFISIACLRPPGDTDAANLPVTYAAVEAEPSSRVEGKTYPRIVFSSDKYAIQPIEGETYYQAVPIGDYDDWDILCRAIVRYIGATSGFLGKLRENLCYCTCWLWHFITCKQRV